MRRWELLHGDCRAVMANMGDATVDSVVTDPPYHLTSIVKRFGPEGAAPAQYGTDGAYARASRGFMGQTWDGGGIAFDPALWAEVLRVLKPGGHLIAFGGTRTYHRMACAIEDAGFEIRDMLGWLYGSGFPKSLDISKAIDKAAGAEREVVGAVDRYRDGVLRQNLGAVGNMLGNNANGVATITAPATDAAREWQGWGTALKPAQEPIVLARKPLDGTVAGNVLAYGTGALNIDGCRVEASDAPEGRTRHGGGVAFAEGKSGFNQAAITAAPAGRWPANIQHDGSDEVLACFPVDYARNGGTATGARQSEYGMGATVDSPTYRDSGSAARFFYCAKASKADRDEGLEHLAPQPASAITGGAAGDGSLRTGGGNERNTLRKNHHPTVKPTALMRYYCRLVTPPGGLIFDPFTGSGSTGKAAMLEGFRFIGAELTAEYVPIAEARIAAALDARVIAK